MIAPVNHIEPVPRRIRATLGARTVLDTTRALYLWESPNYPQYYIPLADVDPDVLVDEQRIQKLSRGRARRHGLRVGDVVRSHAARVYTDESLSGLAGMVRFEWESLDAWVNGGVNLAGAAQPTRATASAVTGSLFRSLGATPFLGRGITPEDDSPGVPMVAATDPGRAQNCPSRSVS